MFTKDEVQGIFARVVVAISGIKYLGNASKQLIQVKSALDMGKKHFDLDFNVVCSDKLSHRDLLVWLSGHDKWHADDTETGNVLLSYLCATISTSLSKRLALNVAIMQEVLAESDMSFEELVKKLQVTNTTSSRGEGGCLTQEFYDHLLAATSELLKVQGYESHRNIFAKTAKKQEQKEVKIKL